MCHPTFICLELLGRLALEEVKRTVILGRVVLCFLPNAGSAADTVSGVGRRVYSSVFRCNSNFLVYCWTVFELFVYWRFQHSSVFVLQQRMFISGSFELLKNVKAGWNKRLSCKSMDSCCLHKKVLHQLWKTKKTSNQKPKQQMLSLIAFNQIVWLVLSRKSPHEFLRNVKLFQG